jgi:DNA-binding response OmpR family regulator
MNISTKAKAKRKVLLVDDEIDVTISLKLFLEENEFEVDTYNLWR